MKTLKSVKWKDFPILEIFNIKATRSSIDKKNLSYIAGNVPYVTRTDRNNGIDLFVDNQPEYQTDEKSVITIGLDTQTVFFQPHTFYTGQNIQVLSNRNLNLYVASFMIPLIKNQLKKFNWGGNGATLGRLKKLRIMLPVTPDGSPDYKFMEQYMQRIEKKLLKRYSRYLEKKGYDLLDNDSSNEGTTVNIEKWGEMLFEDLFYIKSGVRLTKDDMTEGNRPFIGATDSNNGITAFCGNTNKSLDSNCLGVNYNGSVVENFYHPYEALFSDDVKHLHLKGHKGNKYIYLFLKNMILKQKDKYQYGYKFNGERMLKQTLLIPIEDDGSPDYKFMEECMREKEQKIIHRYIEYRLKNV